MATKVDRCIAIGSEREVIYAIPCHMEGHIHSRPCCRGEAPRGTKQVSHGRRIVVIDACLRPGVIVDGTDLIALSRGAVGMDAQSGIDYRPRQSLDIEAQKAADVWRCICPQGCHETVVGGRRAGVNV